MSSSNLGAVDKKKFSGVLGKVYNRRPVGYSNSNASPLFTRIVLLMMNHEYGYAGTVGMGLVPVVVNNIYDNG